MYIATCDRRIQSFCAKVIIIDGEGIRLKNAVHYHCKREELTDHGFSLV